MNSKSKLETAVEASKEHFPETFEEARLDDSLSTLEEYHKYLNQVFNILPMLMSEEEDSYEERGEEEIGFYGEESYEEGSYGEESYEEGSYEEGLSEAEVEYDYEQQKDILIEAAEKAFLSSGSSGITEALSAAYDDFVIRFQGYSLPDHLEAPVLLLFRIAGIRGFIETPFEEVRSYFLSEKKEAEKEPIPDAINIFEEESGEKDLPSALLEELEPREHPPKGMVEISVFDKELVRKPALFKRKTYGRLQRSLVTSSRAFISDTSPYSYKSLFDKAIQEGAEVTPITFSAFFKKYNEKALGGKTGPDGVFVYSTEYTNELLSGIKVELKSFEEKAKEWSDYTRNNEKHGDRDTVERVEAHRQNLADNFDRFVSSIKMRDLFVKNQGEKLDDKIYLTNHLIEDPYLSSIYSILYHIALPDLSLGTFLQKKIDEFKYSKKYSESIKKMYEYGFSSTFHDKIYNAFRKSIESKAKEYLAGESFSSSRGMCGFITSNIGKERIYYTIKKESVPQIKAELISCTVCGKTIVNGFEKQPGTEEQRKRKTIEAKMSKIDIQVQTYSLFKKETKKDKDGRLVVGKVEPLPIEKIRASGARFAPPKSYISVVGGKRIKEAWSSIYKRSNESMTWDEIEDLISSDRFEKSAEGLLRRAEAMRFLGCIPLTTRGISIKGQRFFCPYPEGDGRNSAFPYEEVASSLSRESFGQCGFSVDLSGVIDGSAPSDKTSLPILAASSFSDKNVYRSKASLDGALERAVKEEKVDEATAEKIRRYYKSKSSGGWKFSKNYFRCPTHLSFSNKEEFESLIRKYRMAAEGLYLVTPLAGPISEAPLAIDEFDFESGIIPPPSDGMGGFKNLPEGTSVFPVCGAGVSASSIDPAGFSALIGNLSAEGRMAVIDFMLKLGVDVSDMAFFIDLLGEEGGGGSLESVEAAERTEKLASILRMAASSKRFGLTGAAKRVTSVKFSAEDLSIIGGVVLRCRHGHKFTINNSVHFGAKHYLHDITKLYHRTSTGSTSTEDILAKNSLYKLLQASGEASVKAAVDQGLLVKGVPETTRRDARRSYAEVRSKRGLRPKDVKFEYNGEEYSFPRKGARDVKLAWGAPNSSEAGTVTMTHGTVLKRHILEEYYEASEDMGIGTGKGIRFEASDRAKKYADTGGIDFRASADDGSVLDSKSIASEQIFDLMNKFIARVMSEMLSSCSNFLRLSSSSVIRAPLLGDKLVSFSDSYKGNKSEFEKAIIQLIDFSRNHLFEEISSTHQYLEPLLGRVSGRAVFDKYDFSSFLESFESEKRFLFFLDQDFLRTVTEKVFEALLKEISSLINNDKTLSKGEVARGIGAIGSYLISGRRKHGKFESSVFESPGAIALYKLIGPENKDLAHLTKGLISADTTLKLSKQYGREYYGRVAAAASAHYIAEKLSIIYNLYFRDISPRYVYYEFVGVEEDVFLTPESIIEYCSVSPIVEPVILEVPEDEDSLDDIFDTIMTNIGLLKIDIKQIPIGLNSASLNEYHQDLAIKYIRTQLSAELDTQRVSFPHGLENEGAGLNADSITGLLKDFGYSHTPPVRGKATPHLSKLAPELGSFWKGRDGSVYVVQPGDTETIYRITPRREGGPVVSLGVSAAGEDEDALIREFSLLPAKASLVLNKILSVRPVTKILMGKDSKYARKLSPSGFLSAEHESLRQEGVMAVPTWSAMHYEFKKNKFTHPVFRICDQKGKENPFGIIDPSFDGFLAAGFIIIMTATSQDELRSAIGEAPVLLEEGVYRKLLTDAGIGPEYSLYRVPSRTVGLKIASKSLLSLLDHPMTRVVSGSEGSAVINDKFGFNSSSGFAIGPQEVRHGEANLVPPTIGAPSFTGISIPIEVDPKNFKANDLSIITANIEVAISEGNVIEISDMLQRRPLQYANGLLMNIMRVYNDFQDRKDKLGVKSREKAEAYAKARTKSLFSEYRGLPFNVSMGSGLTSFQRKKKDIVETGPIGFGEKAGGYEVASGIYIPLNNYVLLNKMLTLECFSEEWAGQQILLGDDIYDSDVKTLVKDFLIKSHGLDHIANKIGVKNPEILLDPYGNRHEPDLKGKVEEGDYNSLGLRIKGKTSEVKNMRNKLRDTSGGNFYFVSGSNEDERSYMQIRNLLYDYKSTTHSTEDVLSEIQDKDSDRTLTMQEIYSLHSETLAGYGVYQEPIGPVYPTLPSAAKKGKKVMGVKNVEKALAKYYTDRIEDAYSEFTAYQKKRELEKNSSQNVENTLRKDAKISDQWPVGKKPEVLKASKYSEAIIVSEGLRRTWELIIGTEVQ